MPRNEFPVSLCYDEWLNLLPLHFFTVLCLKSNQKLLHGSNKYIILCYPLLLDHRELRTMEMSLVRPKSPRPPPFSDHLKRRPEVRKYPMTRTSNFGCDPNFARFRPKCSFAIRYTLPAALITFFLSLAARRSSFSPQEKWKANIFGP